MFLFYSQLCVFFLVLISGYWSQAISATRQQDTVHGKQQHQQRHVCEDFKQALPAPVEVNPHWNNNALSDSEK